MAVKQEDKNIEDMAVELLPSFSCMSWVKSRNTSVRIAGDQCDNGTQGRSAMKHKFHSLALTREFTCLDVFYNKKNTK
jgi:hypothetical protein